MLLLVAGFSFKYTGMPIADDVYIITPLASC